MDAPQEGKKLNGTEKSFDILTVLGHDLKSPLNAVEAYLEIIRGRVLGDGLEPYMQILDNSVARLHQMRELITDVVDWSRLQQTPPEREHTVINLSTTVRDVLDGYGPEAALRGIEISTDIEDGLAVKADPGELVLMVRHLVENALRYNRQNGGVRVSINRSGPHIVLDVEDTGLGIDAEDIPRLFGEFVRIKNSRTQDIRGTGLGLAIVRRVTELYGGSVSVQSVPEVGTTFSVTLANGW